jgi:hypothetical protein
MKTMNEVVLTDMNSLDEILPELREDQVRELLMWETMHQNREEIVNVLHSRVSELQYARRHAGDCL